MRLPHSVVEDREVALNCVAEVWGANGDIVWKFKPNSLDKFMDFSVKPVNKRTFNNCTTVINSTLTFNISLYEHESVFRCEIEQHWENPIVLQTRHTDITLQVVPSEFDLYYVIAFYKWDLHWHTFVGIRRWPSG